MLVGFVEKLSFCYCVSSITNGLKLYNMVFKRLVVVETCKQLYAFY